MRRKRLLGAAAIVGLAAVAKFASAPGQSFLLAVFVEDLISDTGTSRTGFSLMYGAATVFSATMVLRVGRAIDRHGIAAVWVAVAAGLAAGCVLLGLAGGPVVVFAALCLMRAFGQGSFPLVGTVLVASRFEAARGRAIGLSAQGITLATAILPVICVALIEALGWRTTLQVIALFLIIAILPLALPVRRIEGSRVPGAAAPVLDFKAAVGMPGVPTLLFLLSISPLVVTGLVIHAVSIAGQAGMSPADAALAIGAMAVVTVPASLGAGAFVDRFGVRQALTGMTLALALSCCAMLAAAPASTFAGYLILGLASGMQLAAGGTVWAKTYGVENLGRLQGLGASGQIAGAAAGPLPLALALSLAGSYAAGLIALAALSLIGAVLATRWHGRPPDAAVAQM